MCRPGRQGLLGAALLVVLRRISNIGRKIREATAGTLSLTVRPARHPYAPLVSQHDLRVTFQSMQSAAASWETRGLCILYFAA
jgi:hypothetical protein